MLLEDKRILWLEDDLHFCSREWNALLSAGAAVSNVRTLSSAIAALAAPGENYDLVIIDIGVPAGSLPQTIVDMRSEAGIPDTSAHNGLVTALWLKRYRPDLRYFFYTVVADLGVRQDRQGIMGLVDPNYDLMFEKGIPQYRENKAAGFVDLVARMLE